MKRGLYLAPFDELADPRRLAELARAAESVGWDGLFLWDRIAYPPREPAVADLPGADELAELAEEVRRARAGSDAPFDLVVAVPPGADVHPWEAAAATWVLASIDPQSSEPEVWAVVDAGP
jgi:hypothetical protein